VQDSYSYLGVTFNYNGNFNTARKKVLDQAQKSLYGLFRKIQNICIPIDLQLKLFDSLVTHILLYSAEVWGFENKGNIEKMHLQFCKKILKVRNSTPNVMLYGGIFVVFVVFYQTNIKISFSISIHILNIVYVIRVCEIAIQ
jgi:hypothetical protein